MTYGHHHHHQTQAQCSSVQNNMVAMVLKLGIVTCVNVVFGGAQMCTVFSVELWCGAHAHGVGKAQDNVQQCALEHTVVDVVTGTHCSWWNTCVHIVYMQHTSRSGNGILQRGGRAVQVDSSQQLMVPSNLLMVENCTFSSHSLALVRFPRQFFSISASEYPLFLKWPNVLD